MPTKQPFEVVVTTHGGAVLRVCRAILGPVDADDAWSETFLSAMKAYPELPADANVQAWLVTIAHRKAIDITRAAGRPGDIDCLAVRDGDQPGLHIGVRWELGVGLHGRQESLRPGVIGVNRSEDRPADA